MCIWQYNCIFVLSDMSVSFVVNNVNIANMHYAFSLTFKNNFVCSHTIVQEFVAFGVMDHLT